MKLREYIAGKRYRRTRNKQPRLTKREKREIGNERRGPEPRMVRMREAFEIASDNLDLTK